MLGIPEIRDRGLSQNYATRKSAVKALSVYGDEDREANFTDLLGDAMHWSKEQGIDFDRARAHYRTETHEAEQVKPKGREK